VLGNVIKMEYVSRCEHVTYLLLKISYLGKVKVVVGFAYAFPLKLIRSTDAV
jgi:hypothetical protein